MIEKERQFPTSEMLERIAAALEIDSPDLFSTRTYPSEGAGSVREFKEILKADIEKVIDYRFKDLDHGIQISNQSQEKKMKR
jgi:hypothetical protein